MNNSISMAELQGRIEALRSTQIALLIALATQMDLDLGGIARSARSWSKKSSAAGDALAAMNAELDILDALASLPKG